MKILLTGGTGFLGGALARKFQGDGHDLVLLLRPASSMARLRGLDCEVVRCDCDAEILAAVARLGPDAVVHTACAYGRAKESPLEMLDANLRLGVALLQGMMNLGSARQPRIFLNSNTALAPTASLYALGKNQFADWGRHVGATEPRSIRFVNAQVERMYGPGDDGTSFTMQVLRACHRNDPVLRLTGCEQRRDCIYIDDVVDAFATILAHCEELGTFVDVPLGCGNAPTNKEVVRLAHRLCGSTTELLFGAIPYSPFEVMHSKADLTLMRRLGWTPAWSLESGLRRTIDLEFANS